MTHRQRVGFAMQSYSKFDPSPCSYVLSFCIFLVLSSKSAAILFETEALTHFFQCGIPSLHPYRTATLPNIPGLGTSDLRFERAARGERTSQANVPTRQSLDLHRQRLQMFKVYSGASTRPARGYWIVLDTLFGQRCGSNQPSLSGKDRPKISPRAELPHATDRVKTISRGSRQPSLR